MKNALILHGTGATPESNWFSWLKKELEKKGYKVWLPQLPQADKPNLGRYSKFLLSRNWDFNQDSVIIGHSSGAVATLGLLQALPEGTKVDTCILVGTFNGSLGWDNLKDLEKVKFDWGKIKSKARKFIFLHSDDDPHCPLDHAKFQAKKLDGELIIKPGEQHFMIEKLPFLLTLLK